MTDHVMGRSDDSRLVSAWYGANADKKSVAIQKAVEYAEAA